MPEPGYLMTPGPTPIPPEVERAMAEPVVYHRGPEFRPLLERVLARLPQVFRAAGETVLLTTSGTGALESAVANLVSPGDRVLVVSAGHFGERWSLIARRYRAEVIELRYPWGETPSPEDVGERLAATAGITAVFCTHAETSTGVVSDVRAIAEQARAAGALTVVDAISSLGAIPLEQDAWALDVVVSGSQKALMTPPGLALASPSAAALEAARRASSPRYYLDWEHALRAQAEQRTPFTPAVTLIRGLDVALDLLLADGLEAAWDRSRRLALACRAGVKALGLELFSPDEDRSAVVTAVCVPEGVDGAGLVRAMRERHGVTVAGGQGELKGKILRIGHIGYVDIDDVAAALEALGLVLADAGLPVEPGAGPEAARGSHAGAVRA
jgi:aspartate aminotransferase-like enzyme